MTVVIADHRKALARGSTPQTTTAKEHGKARRLQGAGQPLLPFQSPSYIHWVHFPITRHWTTLYEAVVCSHLCNPYPFQAVLCQSHHQAYESAHEQLLSHVWYEEEWLLSDFFYCPNALAFIIETKKGKMGKGGGHSQKEREELWSGHYYKDFLGRTNMLSGWEQLSTAISCSTPQPQLAH